MENNTEKTELKKKELSKESSLKYELPDNLLKEMTEIILNCQVRNIKQQNL